MDETKQIETKGTYDKDSKRYHRFVIEDPAKGVVGQIYIRKGTQVPDTVNVVLVTAGTGAK